MSDLLLKWLPPIIIVVIGFLAGLLIEKIVFKKLRGIPKKKKWKVVDYVISALKGMPILWCGIAGIFGAISLLPLSEHTLEFIQKFLAVIIIYSAVVVLARILTRLVKYHGEKAKLPSVTLFTTVTSIVVYVLGVLIILQTLGISITPIITALGIGGLAVALALQDTLSNLFAGFHIIASKEIKPGDYIRLNTGEEGYVVDITWRNTSIRALQNNMFIIPNAKLSSVIITNYYQPVQEMSVLVQVGVHYKSDLQKVEQVTIEVAKEVMKEVPGGVPEFEPFIRYHTFGDFSISFSVILRAKEPVDQYIITHEFVKRLHKRYNEEGIVIPFPIRTIYRGSKEL